MADVFISYARTDRDAAAAVAASLEAHGCSVWWDSSLAGGENFSRRIEQELAAATAVVVLWSQAAAGSDWVRDEAATAKAAGKLVPASIDGSQPPLGFQGLHTIPLSDWHAGDAGFSALLRAIEALGLKRDTVDRRARRPAQDIRFCKAFDGVSIAYATVGDGPPLVKTANWMNHLEHDWESPIWRPFFDAMSARHTLIRYDERGNGLSDWTVGDFSLEAMVADLEAVVDAMGLKRFPLLGLSQGCAVSIEYAARHPEKVSRLVLYGGYARGWRSAPQSVQQRTEAMITLMRSGWGSDNPAFRQLFTSVFIPDATREIQDWFNEMQRTTTSPENAVALMYALGEVDVSKRLADVKAPALVIHPRGDLTVPYKRAREMAVGISGARFITLENRNHIPLPHHATTQRMIQEIEAFLAD
jgi:pimeloyl-ACP methyl ester carboxylesterase